MTCQHLTKLNDEAPVSAVITRLIRSGERMKELLDDLLDYSRVSLDLGIPVAPADMDLAKICQEEVDLQRLAWPSNVVELATEGSTRGIWDASRLKQVIGNLISNGAKYGNPGTLINVRLSGREDEVLLVVENWGPALDSVGVQQLFEPLRRASHGNAETERTSLGLGLFIVRQIVGGHGGEVSASSADGKTVFSVTLPRRPQALPERGAEPTHR